MRRLRLSWLMHGVKFLLPGRVLISLSVLVLLPSVRVCDSSANLKTPKKARALDYSSNVAPARVQLLTRLMPSRGNKTRSQCSRCAVPVPVPARAHRSTGHRRDDLHPDWVQQGKTEISP